MRSLPQGVIFVIFLSFCLAFLYNFLCNDSSGSGIINTSYKIWGFGLYNPPIFGMRKAQRAPCCFFTSAKTEISMPNTAQHIPDAGKHDRE